MKKFLKLLMTAIFASMSCAFVACGDDDDEPDNGNGGSNGQSISLTLDGTKYTFDSGLCKYDSDEIIVELLNPNYTPWINFIFYEPNKLSNGMVLTPDMDLSDGMGPVVLSLVNYEDLSGGGYTLESGSIVIDSINLQTKKFKVTFRNAVFEEFIYGRQSLKVNGTFTVTLDTTWGLRN